MIQTGGARITARIRYFTTMQLQGSSNSPANRKVGDNQYDGLTMCMIIHDHGNKNPGKTCQKKLKFLKNEYQCHGGATYTTNKWTERSLERKNVHIDILTANDDRAMLELLKYTAFGSLEQSICDVPKENNVYQTKSNQMMSAASEYTYIYTVVPLLSDPLWRDFLF